MAKINVKGLIDKHTVNEVTDFAKVNEELENQNKNIVAKEVAKEAKKFDKDIVINEFLKENEFKSMDDFKAFKKNGATADTEAVKRLEGELKEATDKLDEIPGLQKELSTYKNHSLLRGKNTGLTEADLDYYEYKINKLEGETFEEKYDAYVTANPDIVNPTTKKTNVITTGAKIGTKTSTEPLGFEKKLAEKYPNYK